MNYYNPYFINPYATASTSTGLFSRIFRNLSWSSILSGTQKTLGVVNQAIPVVKQMSPIMKNAKTMFKVMNEFKKVDTPYSNIKENKVPTESIEKANYTSSSSDGPTFFI